MTALGAERGDDEHAHVHHGHPASCRRNLRLQPVPPPPSPPPLNLFVEALRCDVQSTLNNWENFAVGFATPHLSALASTHILRLSGTELATPHLSALASTHILRLSGTEIISEHDPRHAAWAKEGHGCRWCGVPKPHPPSRKGL
eukprot:1482638-Rhodomonas_salina.3